MPSKTVLIGGVFDPLHAGHLAYITEARRVSPLVHCCILQESDRHPVLIPIGQRALIIQALGGATHGVTMHTGRDVVAKKIRELKPLAYIKGKDWDTKLPPDEIAACSEVGAEIIYTDTVAQSSSALLADYQRRVNAEQLARFERFVQEQKPADKPWEPVTPYDFESRKAIEGPHAEIIKDTFKPETVVDVGCGFRAVLVRLLRHAGVVAVGFDAIAPPETLTDWYFQGDITSEIGDIGAGKRDLVICREVLEHLTVKQIAVAVRNLVKLSSKYVYLTTRFTAKPHLLGVDGSDDLDPTHITMLNQDYLRSLFVLEGCTRCPDLEAKLDHMKKGRVLVYQVPA